MYHKRNKYKKKWISNKRKRLRDKNDCDAAFCTAGCSDSEDELNVRLRGEGNYNCNVPGINDLNDCDSSSGENAEEQWRLIDSECTNDTPSDNCDSDSSEYESVNLKSDQQAWALDCSVTHHQLNTLLPILRQFHPELPLTAQTLLSTPKRFEM
jgi:hypothetical protein